MTVRRIGWSLGLVLGLAVAAFVAIEVELDRASRQTARFAAWVLPPFRADTDVQMARAAMAAGDANKALALSQSAVRHSPVPAENLSLFVQAALAKGDATAAAHAADAAAARGWRDPAIQLLVIDSALKNGNWGVAAQRIDALQRTGAPREIVNPAVELLSASADGQAALVNQIASAPEWTHDLVVNGTGLKHYAPLVSALARRVPSPVSCADLGSATAVLMRLNAAEEVGRIWAGPCVPAAQDGLHSIDFNTPQSAAEAQPFAWQYQAEAGLDRSFARRGADWRLQYANSDPFSHSLAWRYLRLFPGTYHFRADFDRGTAGAAETPDVRLRVKCSGGQSLLETRLFAEAVPLAVPVGCPFQTVELVAGPASAVGGMGLRLLR